MDGHGACGRSARRGRTQARSNNLRMQRVTRSQAVVWPRTFGSTGGALGAWVGFGSGGGVTTCGCPRQLNSSHSVASPRAKLRQRIGAHETAHSGGGSMPGSGSSLSAAAVAGPATPRISSLPRLPSLLLAVLDRHGDGPPPPTHRPTTHPLERSEAQRVP